MTNKIPLEKIIESRDKCARLIAKYNHDYLPILERLEVEIEKAQHYEKLLARAIKIGTQHGTQNGTQTNQNQHNSK